MVLAGSAAAQPATPEPLCVGGQPEAYCTTIAVTEIGARFGSGTEGFDSSAFIYLNLGLVVNQGHGAWGGFVSIVGYDHPRMGVPEDDDSELAFALNARYRRWLSEYTSVDVSLGGGPHGASAEVAIQVYDLLAITAGAHTMSVDDDFGISAGVGVRFGGDLVGWLFDAIAN